VRQWIKSDRSSQSLLRVFDHAHDQLVPVYLLRGDSPLKARLSSELAALIRSIHREDASPYRLYPQNGFREVGVLAG
jgi:hypothetical protein